MIFFGLFQQYQDTIVRLCMDFLWTTCVSFRLSKRKKKLWWTMGVKNFWIGRKSGILICKDIIQSNSSFGKFSKSGFNQTFLVSLSMKIPLFLPSSKVFYPTPGISIFFLLKHEINTQVSQENLIHNLVTISLSCSKIRNQTC